MNRKSREEKHYQVVLYRLPLTLYIQLLSSMSVAAQKTKLKNIKMERMMIYEMFEIILSCNEEEKQL